MKSHTMTHHPIALAGNRDRSLTARLFGFIFDRYLLLPLGALIALVWANTAGESYFRFAHAVAFPVNEIAMAFFLALVAQEVFEALMPGGALHTWRRWAMPFVAAAGGVAGAAATYVAFVQLKHEVILTQAWPVACAIDVAAAYYLLKVIWPRSAVLPFVLLLGLATDALGVIVVALRPPLLDIHVGAVLLMVAALGTAAVFRLLNVRSFWPYIAICGTLSWFALYWENIHPALALIPIVPFLPHEPRPIDVFADTPDNDDVHHFEHEWNEIVQLVLLMFGLVNAGVILKGYDTATWAMLAAAIIGRPLGMIAAVALAVAIGIRLPHRIGTRELIIVALATSTGFTFALFFATGLLPIGPTLAQVKLGALSTLVAAPITLGVARLLRVGAFARR